MKLLDIEHKLQEPELRASCEQSQRGSRKITTKVDLPNLPRANSTHTIAEQLKDNEKTEADNVGSSNEAQEQDSDMKILCLTLLSALGLKPTAHTEKYISRQTIDKDFPYFNGKPEELPLFIANSKRLFHQVTTVKKKT